MKVRYLILLIQIFSCTIIMTMPTINYWHNIAWCPEPREKCGSVEPSSTDNLVLLDLEGHADKIKSFKSSGKYVICYISAGSKESWRPDASDFPKSVLYGDLKGWEGETWLDITNWTLLKPIMTARLEKAQKAGCNAMEYDNVDFYDNEYKNLYNKENLKKSEIEYLKWLSKTAKDLGMDSFLKNALAIIPDLVDTYDGAINESCHKYKECGSYAPFTNKGKPVLATEYEGDFNTICNNASSLKLKQLVYDSVNLGLWKKCQTSESSISSGESILTSESTEFLEEGNSVFNKLSFLVILINMILLLL